MDWKFWKKKPVEEAEPEMLDVLIKQIEDELDGLDPESDRYKVLVEQYSELTRCRREDIKADAELIKAKSTGKYHFDWTKLILGGVSTVLSLFYFCGGDAAASFASLKEAKEEKKKLESK